MTIHQRFLDQLAHLENAGSAAAELLPSRLASCCYEVLPVAGASISVFTADGFRFPVGANSPRAAYAERLQFTTGEGPSLDLQPTGPYILADDAVISRCWPRFHTDLIRDTPYRAVAAFPFTAGSGMWATVDLYFRTGADLHLMAVPDAAAVVDLVGSLMMDAMERDDPWTDNPVSAARLVTMTAMGLLNTRHGMTAEDALAALRARAVDARMTVDALADAVVHERIALDEMTSPSVSDSPAVGASP